MTISHILLQLQRNIDIFCHYTRRNFILLRQIYITPEADIFTPEADVFTLEADIFTPEADIFTPEADIFTPEADVFALGADNFALGVASSSLLRFHRHIHPRVRVLFLPNCALLFDPFA